MGEFRFARVFRAGMVLQRGCAFTVWGFGAEGEVAVECRGTDNFKTVCRALPDGRFLQSFPPSRAEVRRTRCRRCAAKSARR